MALSLSIPSENKNPRTLLFPWQLHFKKGSFQLDRAERLLTSVLNDTVIVIETLAYPQYVHKILRIAMPVLP